MAPIKPFLNLSMISNYLIIYFFLFKNISCLIIIQNLSYLWPITILIVIPNMVNFDLKNCEMHHFTFSFVNKNLNSISKFLFLLLEGNKCEIISISFQLYLFINHKVIQHWKCPFTKVVNLCIFHPHLGGLIHLYTELYILRFPSGESSQ